MTIEVIPQQKESEELQIKGWGYGNIRAVVVEDFPTNEDIAKKKAFSGFNNKLIDDLAGDFAPYLYKTVLVKSPRLLTHINEGAKNVTKAKFHDYVQGVLNGEGHQYRILENEIRSLGVHLVIPTGEQSFRLLSGLTGLRKYRGSLLNAASLNNGKPESDWIKVIGTHGSHAINSEYSLRFLARIDFERASRNFIKGPIPDTGLSIWTAFHVEALRNYLKRAYTPDGTLVFDFETKLGIPYCVGLCFDGKESCVIPLGDRRVPQADRALMWREFADLMDSPIKKVNQNIKYDWTIAERFGIKVRNVVGDTQLGAGIIYCEFPKNLGFLTSIYTELPYHKDEGKNAANLDQSYSYCGKDTITDWRIHAGQQKELTEDFPRAKPVYENLVKLLPIYMRGENRGIRVDEELRQSKLSKYQMLLNSQTLKLQALIGKKINPRSAKQRAEVVFGDLKYEMNRFVTGTDADSLMYLITMGKEKESIGPIILRCLIDINKINKAIELLELARYPDGRLRGIFNLAGTETGRSSGGKTIDELFEFDEGKVVRTQLGHSLQTLAKHGFEIDGVHYGKDIREIYVPTYGHIFVEVDLSGAEARVDRVLSGQYNLDIFDNPGIHKYTGALVYGCEPSDIKKNVFVDGVDRYFTAKQVRHAGERGIAAGTLASMLLITKPEAQLLLTKFHKGEPQVQEVFHRDVIRIVRETRLLEMPNGRFRLFFNRMDDSLFREAISTVPQAVVSDITKFSFIQTSAENPNAIMLSEQHDGQLWECKKGEEEKLYTDIKRNVEVPTDFRKGSLKHNYVLVIPAEIEVGENWANMKEVKI